MRRDKEGGGSRSHGGDGGRRRRVSDRTRKANGCLIRKLAEITAGCLPSPSRAAKVRRPRCGDPPWPPCGPATAAEAVKYQKRTSGRLPVLRKTKKKQQQPLNKPAGED